MELFDVLNGRRWALPPNENLKFIEGTRTRGVDGDSMVVALPLPGAKDVNDVRYRLGRLHLGDLRLDRGPRVYFWVSSVHAGWLGGGRGDDYFLFNAGTGALFTARAKHTEWTAAGLALRLRGHAMLLLDPVNGRMAQTKRDASIPNGNGCFVAMSGKVPAGIYQNLDRGPWIRICVAANPPDAKRRSL